MTILDTTQTKFCQASIGNIRLLAPAGCGKTLLNEDKEFAG